MILWQFLVERAESQQIDTDRIAAKQFWGELPIIKRGRFSWREWQRNLAALRWFADQRQKKRRIKAPMPPDVDEVTTRILSRTRVGIVRVASRPGWNVELRVKLTRRDGKLAREHPEVKFDDTDVFWQAAFLSFFAPEHVSRMRFCGWCGNPLEDDPGQLCRTCRVRKSRAENPEHYRQYERDRKRRERAEYRRSKKPGR